MSRILPKIINELPNTKMTENEIIAALEVMFEAAGVNGRTELANLLGTHPATIAGWVYRRTIPSDVILWFLLKYNLSFADLFWNDQ